MFIHLAFCLESARLYYSLSKTTGAVCALHTQNISHGNPFYFNRNEVIAMNKPLLATYCTNKAIPMLTEEDIRLLDIVYIGFGRVDGTQVCLDELTNLKRMADIRRVNPGIRLILTTASGENGGFPAGTRTEADIRALAVNLAGAVKAYGFDGLDIDWEYPTVNGDPTERHRHTLLLKALREELDKLEGHRTLSIAAGCKTWYFQITELSESVAYLDYVNLMTYDINANNPYTMHHACAYPMATDRETEGSAAENIEVFHRHGVPLDKIIIGAAFYSRQWKHVQDENHGLHAFSGEGKRLRTRLHPADAGLCGQTGLYPLLGRRCQGPLSVQRGHVHHLRGRGVPPAEVPSGPGKRHRRHHDLGIQLRRGSWPGTGHGQRIALTRKGESIMHVASSTMAGSRPLQEIYDALGIHYAKGGVEVYTAHIEDLHGVEVKKAGNRICIRYSEPAFLYRGVGLAVENSHLDRFTLLETPRFSTNGLMLDCSRNAVASLPTLKTLIRQLALMGHNTLMLYTEDTYTVEGQPYFGYMRGRYTETELRELDEYASSFGIELVPCIQTLAHLQSALQWDAYRDIRDIDDILLADDERTYALIRPT